MRVLLESEHFRLTIDDPPGVVRFTRTPARFASSADAIAGFDAIVRITEAIDRAAYGLLSDLRQGPGRNDEGFEKGIGELSARLFGGFRKRATVVGTAAGRLQVQRLQRERFAADAETAVFTSEEQAVAYLIA